MTDHLAKLTARVTLTAFLLSILVMVEAARLANELQPDQTERPQAQVQADPPVSVSGNVVRLAPSRIACDANDQWTLQLLVQECIMKSVLENQSEFFQRYLMGRVSFNPMDFGVDRTKDDFMDEMVDDFDVFSRGEFSLDEMLLRPRVALQFIDYVRTSRRYWDAPDDIILRSIMTRRKNP